MMMNKIPTRNMIGSKTFEYHIEQFFDEFSDENAERMIESNGCLFT